MSQDYIQAKVAEKERTYPEGMTAREKAVYREQLKKEDEFESRRWVQEELQAKHGEERSRAY